MVLLSMYSQKNSGGLDSVTDFPTDFLQDLMEDHARCVHMLSRRVVEWQALAVLAPALGHNSSPAHANTAVAPWTRFGARQICTTQA